MIEETNKNRKKNIEKEKVKRTDSVASLKQEYHRDLLKGKRVTAWRKEVEGNNLQNENIGIKI